MFPQRIVLVFEGINSPDTFVWLYGFALFYLRIHTDDSIYQIFAPLQKNIWIW